MLSQLKVLFILIALSGYPLSAKSFLNRILGRFCDDNEIFVLGRICKHQCSTIMEECESKFALGCHCKPDYWRNDNDKCVHIDKCLHRSIRQIDDKKQDELPPLPPVGDSKIAIFYSHGKLWLQGKDQQTNVATAKRGNRQCERNETLAMHNVCPKLCVELKTPSICRLILAPSCSCKPGYLYNRKGVCVRMEECRRGIPGEEKERKKNKRM